MKKLNGLFAKVSFIISLILLLFIIGFIVYITPATINWYKYSISVPGDIYLTQDNYFDVYEGVEVKGFDSVEENVTVYNTELLGLTDGTKGRITEFGSFTLRYCLIKDEEVIEHVYRTIYVSYEKISSGLIYNGDFLGGLNEWGIVDWQNSLNVSVVDDVLKIQQTSVDSYIWDQSLYQYVSNLEVGKKYKISFDAKSTTNKVIKVCLAQPLSDYPYAYNLMNEYDIEINNAMSTYEIEFNSLTPVEQNFDFVIELVRLEFKFGMYNDSNNTLSTIFFDNIIIEETL